MWCKTIYSKALSAIRPHWDLEAPNPNPISYKSKPKKKSWRFLSSSAKIGAVKSSLQARSHHDIQMPCSSSWRPNCMHHYGTRPFLMAVHPPRPRDGHRPRKPRPRLEIELTRTSSRDMGRFALWPPVILIDFVQKPSIQKRQYYDLYIFLNSILSYIFISD